MKRSELVTYLDGVTHQQLGAWLDANPEFYMKGIETLDLNGVAGIKCKNLTNGAISYFNRKLEKLVRTAFDSYVPENQVVPVVLARRYGTGTEYVSVAEYPRVLTCPVSGVQFIDDDGVEIDGEVICKHLKNIHTRRCSMTGERHLTKNMIELSSIRILETGDVVEDTNCVYKELLNTKPEEFGKCEISGETVFAKDLVEFMGKKVSTKILYRLGYIAQPDGSLVKLSECIFIQDLGWVKESDIDLNVWRKCEICGKYHKLTTMAKYDGDIYICKDCQRSSNIGGYHSGRSNNIYRPLSLESDNTKLFFGAEIETEGNKWSSALVQKNYGDLFHCESDGSLSYGYEVISQPMTMNYLKSKSETIKEMFKKLVEFGQKSDETSTCGLHIHTSRDAYVDEEAIARACYIVCYFQSDIEALSRRRQNNYANYALMKIDGNPTTKKIMNKVKSGGRYCCVNVQNSNTIEYRMFKGTLNPNTFFASVELVDNIVRMANSKRNIFTFSDLLSGEYLPAYVDNRTARNHSISFNKKIDMTGMNQDELLARLKEKWAPIKAIREYNANHPEHPITAELIFGGAR